MEDINLIWAKLNPEESLLTHSMNAGRIMRIILTESIYKCDLDLLRESFHLNSNEEVIDLMCYLASSHDIGKCDIRFQYKKIDEHRYERFRHEYESGQFLYEKLKRKGYDSAVFFGNMVALHHQKYHDNESDALIINAKEKQLNQERMQMFDDIFEKTFHPVFPSKISNADTVGLLCLALIIFADWIASSSNIYRQDYLEEDVVKFLKDCNLSAENKPVKIEEYSQAWPYIQEPRNVQKVLKQYVDEGNEIPLFAIIEDACGGGKSESSQYLGSHMGDKFGKYGMDFCLPTGATANAMFDRVNAMLAVMAEQSARLIHSNAMFNENQKFSSEAEKWFTPSRLALLQKNCVSTVDQAMSAALPNKFSCLRFLGLSSKVLIIDEVHGYDWYMLAIIEVLLRYCKQAKIPVILVSATMTTEKKKELLSIYTGKDNVPTLSDHYPLITMAYENKKEITQLKGAILNRQFYNIKFAQSKSLAVSRMCTEANHGGCYLYIANTIKSAYRVKRNVQKLVGDDVVVMMLHGDFFPIDRQRIEKLCIERFGKDGTNRPVKAILIGTQVLEQSLDIDLDGLFTELAPMDILIQRIGRVWRHFRAGRNDGWLTPHIWIINENYDIYRNESELLANTRIILKQEQKILIPDDIRSYIDVVVAKSGSVDDLTRKTMKAIGFKNALPVPRNRFDEDRSLFSDSGCAMNFGKDDDELYTSTRLGVPQVAFALVPQNVLDYVVARIDEEGKEKDGHYLSKDCVQYIYNHRLSKYETTMRPFIENALLLRHKQIGHLYLIVCDVKDDVFFCETENKTLTYDSENGMMIRQKGEEEDDL